MAFLDRLGHLIIAEENSRDDRWLKRLLKTAKLKVNAHPEVIIFEVGRGLDRSQIAELITGQWLRSGDNVLLTGPTGSGKTWMACALGYAAIMMGHTVRYFRTNQLLQEMALAQVDGTARRLLVQLTRIELLILDDFAVAPICCELQS